MSLAQGFTQLGAGLSVGLAGLAAGFAVGIVGDAGVRGTAQQPRLFVGMVRVYFDFQTQVLTNVDPRSLFLSSLKSWVFMVCLLQYVLHNLSFFFDPIFIGLIVALIMNTKAGAMTVNILSFPVETSSINVHHPVLSAFLHFRNGMRQKGVG